MRMRNPHAQAQQSEERRCLVVLCWLPLAVLLFQAPGDGWATVQAPPREVKRLYWELFQTTEIWLRLIPEDPDGKPPLVNLIFQAFFPGRAKRDPYSGLPQWPKSAPVRLALRAQPLPWTVIRELSLRLQIDGNTCDLTTPGSRHRNLPCLVATEDCTPNAVEVELEPSLLRSLISARTVGGHVLGFTVRLTSADQAALADFAARIGISREDGPTKEVSLRQRWPLEK